MVIAALALVGFFVALYLWFWKIGLVGDLSCGAGGCEAVQTSPYAEFLGVPVALIGVGGYLVLLGVSLAGLQPRWAVRRWLTVLLLVLAGVGVTFTVYLTYLEAMVIEAWCRYCVASAALIGSIFMVAAAGLKASD